MTDDQKGFESTQNLLSAWIKSSSEFWGSMLQAWSPSGEEASDDKTAASDTESGNKSRTRESFESVLKTWRTLSTVASDSGAMDAASNLGHVMPDVMLKMVRASWEGFFHLQQQWLEKAGRIGRRSQAYTFENLDEEAFKTWTDIYEREFKQFFYLPQLGLTRLYQEKFNRATDKFNSFQAVFSEFMTVFLLPMDKSFKVLQDEVAKMAEAGSLPEDYNTYYKLWIKILEGHYMTLYKSPEYLESMKRTLQALEEFLLARDAVTQDVLKWLAVPTQKDLDDLYREIYQLKKRIRKYEKKH